MAVATDLEKEVRLYWRVMQDGVAAASLAEYRDDLDTIALMTDSPVLRDRCMKNMRRFDHLGKIAKVANGP